MSSKPHHDSPGHNAGSQLPGQYHPSNKISTSEEVTVGASTREKATSFRSGKLRRANSFQYSRRSRRLGAVISHACAGCRQKRVKCDGQLPCRRCKLRGAECVYKTNVSQSKAQLRTELYALQQRQHTFEQLVAALLRQELNREALGQIQSSVLVNRGVGMIGTHTDSSTKPTRGEPEGPVTACLEVKASTLDTNQHSDMQKGTETKGQQDVISELLSQLSCSRRYGDPRIVELHREATVNETVQVLPQNDSGVVSLSKAWTSVTGDIELIHHLLALYFCWEYPNFAPISKEHFLLDFREGRHRYCSPMLVNALLALGSHLSDRTLTTSDGACVTSDTFFEESRRLFFSSPDQDSLTIIQALVIMSIREARCNRSSESTSYARQAMQLAIEKGLHKPPAEGCEVETAVLANTFWGAFTLNQAWSLVNGTLPQCSDALRLPPKPAVTVDVEISPWVPYIGGDAHLEPHVQLSNVRSVYKCFCELNEIIRRSLYLLHSPVQCFTAAKMARNYHQYLDWYDKLPEAMRLGHNSTPAVLFTHLYYHFSVLRLFWPFLRLRLIGSLVIPLEVCVQAAAAIQGLVSSYSKLYTLRRTPTFVPYFTFAAAAVQLSITSTLTQLDRSKISIGLHHTLNPSIYEALTCNATHLTETALYHPFANQALHILHCLNTKWSVNVDAKESAAQSNYLLKPRDVSGLFLTRNTEVTCPFCGTSLDGVPCTEGAGTAARSIEVPFLTLLWLQDRPTLNKELDLEQIGYSLL